MQKVRHIASLAFTVAMLTGALFAMGWLIQTKPVPPTRRTAFGGMTEVRVASVISHSVDAPVVGHGTVRAKNQVDIVPQVSGKLVHVHKDLSPGKVIAKGQTLFSIDSTVYEARRRQAEAEVRGLEAALNRHDQELANLNERIANAEELLAIDLEDYNTSKKLFDVEKVGAQRDVDLVRQKYLRQMGVVVELTSGRSMVPYLKQETQAQLDAAQARLSQADHDLGNTNIQCPFAARVEKVAAYTAQAVTAHFSIATLTDIEALELSVGIDPTELRWLDESIRPSALEQEGERSGPEVKVLWALNGQEFTWRGRVTRFERIDELTRTARMVIEIRAAEMIAGAEIHNGELPALSIGMYCRAELPIEPLAGAIFVPRHAIYDNEYVYIFDADGASDVAGHLARRRVKLLRFVGDSVLVDYADRAGDDVCELQHGDQLVVSPLAKPVEGMPVRLAGASPPITATLTASASHRSFIGEVDRRVDPVVRLAKADLIP